MKNVVRISTIFAAALFSAAPAWAAVITKDPDLGPFWHPLNSGTGTYVYADSFIAPTDGTVSSLGTWLLDQSGANSQQIIFDVVGTAGGGGPDMSNVFASTGVLNLSLTTTLDLYIANPVLSAPLIAGQTYWFAADVRGLISGDSKQVGAHTQNSEGIIDDGTFWYSNDPTGASFDGINITPEMAFTATIGPAAAVPEPLTLSIFGAGLAGMAALRRRKRRA